MKPRHVMPSLNDWGWNSQGARLRHAIANHTCQVVITKTYVAPNRDNAVSITT